MDQRATLTDRVRRLELEAVRWRFLAVGSLLILAGVVLIGAAPANVADELRAKRFVAVDAHGVPRAVLGQVAVWQDNRSDPYNEPESSGLALYDGDKRLRAAISLRTSDRGAPKLALYDEKETRRTSLQVTASGVPMLSLAADSGIDRAWLEVAGNRPALVLRDEAGRQRVVLGGFSMYLKSGVTELRPTSSLVLIAEDGRILWKAP
jgi:hypothetical protein